MTKWMFPSVIALSSEHTQSDDDVDVNAYSSDANEIVGEGVVEKSERLVMSEDLISKEHENLSLTESVSRVTTSTTRLHVLMSSIENVLMEPVTCARTHTTTQYSHNRIPY